MRGLVYTAKDKRKGPPLCLARTVPHQSGSEGRSRLKSPHPECRSPPRSHLPTLLLCCSKPCLLGHHRKERLEFCCHIPFCLEGRSRCWVLLLPPTSVKHREALPCSPTSTRRTHPRKSHVAVLKCFCKEKERASEPRLSHPCFAGVYHEMLLVAERGRGGLPRRLEPNPCEASLLNGYP